MRNASSTGLCHTNIRLERKKKGMAENHVLRELFFRRNTSYKRNHYHLSSPVIGKF